MTIKDYAGLPGIRELHAIMGDDDGGTAGKTGRKRDYKGLCLRTGDQPDPIRAVNTVYCDFCSWPVSRARFRRTASAKSNIIIPRPRGSEPGSRPTMDYEGLKGTTKKERRAQLENGGHRDYIGLGRTAKQEADYKRSRGTTD